MKLVHFTSIDARSYSLRGYNARGTVSEYVVILSDFEDTADYTEPNFQVNKVVDLPEELDLVIFPCD